MENRLTDENIKFIQNSINALRNEHFKLTPRKWLESSSAGCTIGISLLANNCLVATNQLKAIRRGISCSWTGFRETFSTLSGLGDKITEVLICMTDGRYIQDKNLLLKQRTRCFSNLEIANYLHTWIDREYRLRKSDMANQALKDLEEVK